MREANFGSKIRQHRLQSGLTQAEFASRIGVTNITVSKWENERQTPSLNRMAELRRVLDANPGDQYPVEGLLPPTGTWSNRTGVMAVMTGVVMSIKTGISVPGVCDREVDSTPAPQHPTFGGTAPGTPPDVRLPRRAGDATGGEAAVATTVGVGEPAGPGRHGADPSDEHPARCGVGEFIDFDPHDPGELPALSGIYVLYDISDRPLYVGQGKAIDKRIRDHNDKFWFRSPIVETASYVQIDDRALRERVEALLIKFLKSNAVINKRFVDR